MIEYFDAEAKLLQENFKKHVISLVESDNNFVQRLDTDTLSKGTVTYTITIVEQKT